MRLAGLATIVAGNLLILQWFRGGFDRGSHANRVFHGLVLAVCIVGLAVVLVAPLAGVSGFPATPDARWVVAALGPPAASAAWRLRHADRASD